MSQTQSIDLRDVLEALERAGCKPRKHGAGYQAKCPAHEDSTPSLSVSEGNKAPFVIKCFAGCEYEQIMSALGFDLKKKAGPKFRTIKGGRSPKEPPPPPARLPSIGESTLAIYFYPNAKGEKYFAVVRKPGKKFSQRTHDSGDLWSYVAPKVRPLYRLPELMASHDRVAIVEGEKDADSIARTWPDQTSTTWSGGTDSWKHTDWEPLRGRRVSLISDGDAPGRKAAKGIAAHLHSMECDVVLGLVAGKDGVDVTAWIDAEGPQGAAKLIRDHLKPYDPGNPDTAPEQATQAQSLPALDTETLAANQFYRILGLTDDHIAVRLGVGRIMRRSREAVCQTATLVAMAPINFWIDASGADQLSRAVALSIGDHLIREADRLGPVDLAIMRGRGALRTDEGEVAWHLGDRVLMHGDEVPLENRAGIWLAEPRIDLPASATSQEVSALSDAIMAYRWATNADARRFLGWIPAAVAGGAMEWRPHIIISGPAGTGKSWMIREVLRRLLGPLAVPVADGSEASVARITSFSSLPIVVDEAEPKGDWILGLLKLLRIASGGEGLRLRADGSGTGVTAQEPRFSALLSAIKVPDLGAADSQRISIIRLGPKVPDWPKVLDGILKAMTAAPGIRARMIRDTPALVKSAQHITRELQSEGKVNSRQALMAGALTAGWQWWQGPESTDDQVVFPYASRADVSDAKDALLELLTIRFRDSMGQDVSLAEVVSEGNGSDQERAANSLGVQYDADDGLMVCPYHKGLKAALTRTALAGADLRELLGQIEGATYTANPRRFGKFRFRAIVINNEALSDAGINL